MGTRIVAFRLEADEGEVLVEERTPDEGAMVGGADLVREAGQSFEAALARIRPIASAVRQALADLAPGEVAVEFGITLKAEAGVIIASTAAEGSLKVSIKWKPGG